MKDKVFSISGGKLSTFIIDENSLKFSSQNFKTLPEFQKAWEKKLSLATTIEFKYDSIKFIKKVENEDEIHLKHKAIGGFMDRDFSFTDKKDYEIFFNYFIQEQYYQKTVKAMKPFMAVRNYLIGLFATIGFTALAYLTALDIANGTNGKALSPVAVGMF